MNEFIAQEPMWLQAWMMTMGLVNLGAIVFAFRDVRAHWVVTAFLANLIFMPMLFAEFGYTRILGLSHVIFWTPLLVYLWLNRNAAPEKVWSTRYLYLVMLINGISLVIDYVDVVRFLLGDGALT